MINFFLILLILLILIVLFLPYVTKTSYVTKTNEKFSNDFYKSVMEQSSIITNTGSSSNPLLENNPLLKTPEPVYVPPSPAIISTPTPKLEWQNQVMSELSPEVQALLSPSQLSSITPVNNKPIELCKCNCDEMQKKIDDNCKNVKAQLEQCQLNLEQQKNACSAQNDNILMQSTNNITTTNNQINQQNEKNLSSVMELDTCTSKNTALSSSNNQLLLENARLIERISEIEKQILDANNSTQTCYYNTQKTLTNLKNSLNTTTSSYGN